jgi:predicted 3-demethylubiquinone-9 3-methyltransferase (glyoxalase superfamily)
MRRQIWFWIAIVLASLPQTAPAPIYGAFESLDALIKGADFIVVAEIVKKPREEDIDIGGGGDYDIQVEYAIKGDVKAGKRATAYLRDLGLSIGPAQYSSLTQGYVVGERYLLFLNKPGTHFHEQDGKPPSVDFENENCEGDAIWISSPTPFSYFKVESLKGKSVRESIVTLLNQTAIQHQRFATAVQAIIESKHGDPIPRTTPLLVFSDNAEEAAKFYVSVFSDPKRPYPTGRSKIVEMFRNLHKPEDNRVFAVIFLLDGQEYLAFNAGSAGPVSAANAFALNCNFKDETQFFESKISAGGQKMPNGWIKDKFGVLWNFGPDGIKEGLRSFETGESN